jgi:hypothetical protein
MVGGGDLTHPVASRHPCLEKVLHLGRPQDRTFRSSEGNLLGGVGVDPVVDGSEYRVHVLFDIGIGEAKESYAQRL